MTYTRLLSLVVQKILFSGENLFTIFTFKMCIFLFDIFLLGREFATITITFDLFLHTCKTSTALFFSFTHIHTHTHTYTHTHSHILIRRLKGYDKRSTYTYSFLNVSIQSKSYLEFLFTVCADKNFLTYFFIQMPL